MLRRTTLLALLALAACVSPCQGLLRRTLFLGNSYTYVNNLPGLTAGLAHYSGDSLYFESNTPGGYTLGWQPIAHATNATSLQLIGNGGWDFVVLQEQSQIPSITRLRDSCMIPAAESLHNAVKTADSCTRVLFYLTWGRRFGGEQCFTPDYCSPVFAGFGQMQDSVTRSYKMAADSLNDWLAPVGEAWRFVIDHTGMVLHDADLSHPNLNGSYLAACVFYDVMFGKPSAGNLFTAGLAADTALLLQKAADSVTFGYAGYWNIGNDLPSAAFQVHWSSDTLFTSNSSSGATNWLWDFGDGITSALAEPWHIYQQPGTYTIRLSACNNCFCDSAGIVVQAGNVGTAELPAGQVISFRGPDPTGKVSFTGFSGCGKLELFDLEGRRLGLYDVQNGEALTGQITCRLMLWRLTDARHRTIGRGIRLQQVTGP